MPAQTTVSTKLSITIDRENKTFQGKTIFMHYLSTKTALQKLLEEKFQCAVVN